jgi:hypothetical protein
MNQQVQRFFWDMFSFKHYCCPVAIQLQHGTFVISFHAALNLPLKTDPLFCTLYIAGVGYFVQDFGIVFSMYNW